MNDMEYLMSLLIDDDHIETEPLTSVLRNFSTINYMYYNENDYREFIIGLLDVLGIEVIKANKIYYIDHIYLSDCMSPEHYEALDKTVFPNFLDHASTEKFDDQVFSLNFGGAVPLFKVDDCYLQLG